MKTANRKDAALHDCKAADRLNDEEWVNLHVPRFQRVRGNYQEYETFLALVLKEISRRLAPMAIVNARAKGLPSFAEKILRKRRLYADPHSPLPPDPLARMTDLCGGRIITHTAVEVERVCEFIKTAFDIDWDNSEDASRRLKPTEFGYRSVHYIVMVNEAKLREAGIDIPVPRSIEGLKAEIQVRTLLEHASADIGHDTLYKAGMKVPDPIQRQFAAVAATLESTDREFGRLLASLNDLRSQFGAWHLPDEVKSEMERLRIVLRCDPGNDGLAVKIGQLALSLGEHQAALEVLQPFAGRPHPGVQRLRGLALTEQHWLTPAGPEFQQGVEQLEAACRQPQSDAETLCALAECYAHRGDDERASELYRKAIVVDPSEPLSFCRFLEFEVARQRNDATVRLAEPMIHRAMDRCRREIEAGVNLPTAWSCLAIFQLLLRQPYEALESLVQVLTLCGKPTAGESRGQEPCAAGRTLRRTRTTLGHLGCLRERLAGFDWLERLLLIALAVKVPDAEAAAAIQALASWQSGQPHFQPNSPVVILSGGCSASVRRAVAAFRPHWRRAVEGRSLTLVSGGTRAGVSGLAGEAAVRSGGRILAFGYLPERLPEGIQPDRRRYTAVFETRNGRDFTPIDPLQGWTDIVAAGLDPRQVKLIGFAGKQIARVEYAVALALGARVGMVDDDRVPADRRFKDPRWQGHPGLVVLPLDAMTLRAFLQIDTASLSQEERRRLEGAARMAHEDYARSAIPREPSLRPWEQLDDSLKLSNYHQVAYWESMLREFGIGVRVLKQSSRRGPLLSMKATVGDAGITKLAEMEHGRWNVERLSHGWRCAKDKDVAKKLSPYLVPWKAVPKKIQQYDLDAIVGLPGKLHEAGLELYPLPPQKEARRQPAT